MRNLNINKSNKLSNKKLATILLIGFLTFLMLSSLNFNGIAKTNEMANYEDLSISAPGPATDSSSGNYRIDPWDTDDITQAEIDDFAQVLDDTYDLLVGTWNFPDPMLAANEPPIEVTIESLPGYNGWASGPSKESNFKVGFNVSYINQGFAADHEPLKVAGHELFHISQYAHPGTAASKWVREGQARMIQDKLSDWLDHADGTEAGSSFVRQTQSYLSGSHTSDLTTISYSSCLFWQYYCEQFGSDHTDPDYGVDAITEYWSTAANPSGSDGITMLNNALNNLSPGTTFEDVFEDFSIAIYTKDLTTATVPSKWTFIDDDETDGSGNYGTVSREIDPIPTLLAGGDITDPAETINAWANKYYEVNIDPGVEAITIEFDQSTNNNLFYALLAMNGDDLEYSYSVESKDFRRAIVNNNYDKIVVIVVGLENSVSDPASFDYTFEAGSPEINIESPQETPIVYHARVGPHNAPEKFISIVDIYYRQNIPVHGFFTENFRAQVGGIDATVLSAVDVYGKYFLIIQAPDQAVDDVYNLEIELVDSDVNMLDSDLEPLCVEYGEIYYDLMLSIDRSGSMGTADKILAAQSAGILFVDSFLTEDQLGVVEFESSATVIHDLMKLTSGNRSAAIGKIEAIITGGATSVGDGLFKSQNQLFTNGITDYPDHIILLSDGKENTPPTIANILPLILGNGTIVHVITIGADAAYEDMQELAADTGGTYFHCFDPSSGDISNDLAELYRAITEDIQHMERFYHSRGTILSGNIKEFKLEVTDDMDIVEFIVHYNASTQPTPIELIDPDLIPVSYDYTYDKSGMGHTICRKINPKVGEWTIRITVGPASSDLLYFVEGAAHTYITMTLLTPPNGIISPGWGNTEKIGTPIPVLVSITDTKEIKDAEVHMSVIPPGYKSHSTLFQIPLYDDGNHGDSLPNDGIYGNLYTATSEEGSYQFLINATGIDNNGRAFTRIRTGAFYMTDQRQEVFDSDADGLPDHWEIYYGLKHLDNTGDHGASGDPDEDGLKNVDEFFHGTDPLNSDTDFGGQGDNSEVNLSLNPLDPDDDSIRKFPPVRVFPGNNHVYIILPNATTVNYVNLDIYRSTHPIFGYSIIYNSNYVEYFNDTTASNYNTYYYRFLADSGTGLTKSYKAIPKLNNLAAEACVIINNGSKTTKSNSVTVKVNISRNDETTKLAFAPTQMRIGEEVTTLLKSPWISFDPEFQMLLSLGKGVKFVFVQLRDNQTIPEVSPIFSAGIRYTGEEVVIGLESTVVIFMITVDFIVASVVFYKKKRKRINIKKF